MLVKLTTVVNFINILGAAFAPILLTKKLQSQTVTREKQGKTLLYKKGARKMFVKLTTGDVNSVLYFNGRRIARPLHGPQLCEHVRSCLSLLQLFFG
jgi:hypothetical protein